MALSRFVLPFADVGGGIRPSSGAKLFFYATGTSTPATTFSDSTGTTPNTNPVIADANGVFPNIFINGIFKAVLKDKNDVQIWEADPVSGIPSIGTDFDQVPLNSDIVYPVANVTALRALTGISVGQSFCLEGHTNSKLGSGALLCTKAHGSEVDDNGSLFVVDGKVIERTSSKSLTLFDFGGIPEGDSTSAWIAAANWLNATSGTLTIPSGRALVTSAPAIYNGTVIHEDGGIIVNTANDSTNFWNNTCVFYGSYFGIDSGVLLETSYSIQNAAAGDNVINFTTSSESSDFSIGDIVFAHGASKYAGTDFFTASFVSIVTVVGTGFIQVRDPVMSALLANGASATLYKQSGTLANTETGKPAFQKMAQGVRVINGQYESQSKTFSQVVHISAIDCDFEISYAKGRDVFGINPCAHTKIDILDCQYYRRGLELAYFHYKVISDFIKVTQATEATDTTQSITPFSTAEFGEGCSFGIIDISASKTLSDVNNACFAPTTPRHTVEKLITSGGTGLGASFTAGRATDIVVNIAEIKSAATNGIRVSADRVTIKHLVSSDVLAAFNSAKIDSGVSGTKILSGYLGDGAGSGEQYSIFDDNKGIGNTVKNVINHFSQLAFRERGFSDIAGIASLELLRTYTVLAGTSTKNAELDINIFGNLSGTTGAKTIRLSIGSNNFDLAAGAGDTGFFSFSVRFYKGDSNTANQGAIGTIQSNWASDQNIILGLSNNMGTADFDVSLSANMSVGDSLKLRQWEVKPLLDQIAF
jgi:hypothetical protein